MASASSTFTGTENPLSEGGVWVSTSAYWADMRKLNGLGVAIANSNDTAKRYTGTTFGADQFSEITLNLVPAGAQLFFHYCFVRMNATAGTYLVTTAADVGPNILQLFAVSNAGAYTQIGTNITLGANFAANDVMRLEVSGTALTVKFNGSTVRSATDSTFSTGQPGVGGWAQSNSDVLFTKSWSGGDLVAAAGAPPLKPRTPNYLFSL